MPEDTVFSTPGSIHDSKKYFCNIKPLPVLFLVAKAISRVTDTTLGTKNGVFWYSSKRIMLISLSLYEHLYMPPSLFLSLSQSVPDPAGFRKVSQYHPQSVK